MLPWQQASCTHLVQRCHSNGYTPKCTMTATAHTGAPFHTVHDFNRRVTETNRSFWLAIIGGIENV